MWWLVAPGGSAQRCVRRCSAASSAHATHRWLWSCQRTCSRPRVRHCCNVEFATPHTRSKSDNHHAWSRRGGRRRLRGGCTPRRRLTSTTDGRLQGVACLGAWHPSWARPAVICTVLEPACASARRRSHSRGSSRQGSLRLRGRVLPPVVLPPPIHAIVLWRRSRLPAPATITRWMLWRTRSVRSAIVVVGACHRAGTWCARGTMASRSAAESARGCVCTKRSYSSCRRRWAMSLSSHSLARWRATQRWSGSLQREWRAARSASSAARSRRGCHSRSRSCRSCSRRAVASHDSVRAAGASAVRTPCLPQAAPGSPGSYGH